MLTSSTQLQKRSFHVVERTRVSWMSSKCQKMKNARAKRAKKNVFYCQICKFVTFLLPSSSWLRKLPIRDLTIRRRQRQRRRLLSKRNTAHAFHLTLALSREGANVSEWSLPFCQNAKFVFQREENCSEGNGQGTEVMWYLSYILLFCRSATEI